MIIVLSQSDLVWPVTGDIVALDQLLPLRQFFSTLSVFFLHFVSFLKCHWLQSSRTILHYTLPSKYKLKQLLCQKIVTFQIAFDSDHCVVLIWSLCFIDLWYVSQLFQSHWQQLALVHFVKFQIVFQLQLILCCLNMWCNCN